MRFLYVTAKGQNCVQTSPCKCKICISSVESDAYSKKKIQMFVANMTFISSREVEKMYISFVPSALMKYTYFVEDTDIIGIRRLIPRDHFVIKYVDVNGQLRRRGLSVSVLRKQLLPLSEWFVLLNIDFVNSFTAIGDKIGFCKQHRSRWDSSMSHLIWIYAVWHSVFQLYI